MSTITSRNTSTERHARGPSSFVSYKDSETFPQEYPNLSFLTSHTMKDLESLGPSAIQESTSDYLDTHAQVSDSLEQDSYYSTHPLSPSDFDFFTPSSGPFSEQSVQPTPSEIIWEPSFDHGLSDLGCDASIPTTVDPQLLSPRITNPPSPPEPNDHMLQPSSAHTTNGLRSPAHDTKMDSHIPRPTRLQVNLHLTPAQSASSSNASLQASPLESNARAPSPIVTFSSYNRGDSPARSQFPLQRSSSKRSHTSRSPQHLAPEQHEGFEDDLGVEKTAEVLRTPTQTQRSEDGSWIPSGVNGHRGINPAERGNELVPSLKDIEEQRQLNETNLSVESWLAEAGSNAEGGESSSSRSQRTKANKSRLRAHSTGANTDAVRQILLDESILPGPGALVDEESGVDESDGEGSQSSDATPDTPPFTLPPLQELPPELEEPHPHQFYRPKVWQDPAAGNPIDDARYQPENSNAAMMRFDQQIAKFETASRAATWGTGQRRLSETDVCSIVEGSGIRHLSLSKEKGRERKPSLINKARGIFPRRSSSNVKKKNNMEVKQENPSSEVAHKKRGDSLGNKALQRIPSFSKSSKSPHLNTGRALMAMSGQIAAVGRSTSVTPDLTAGLKRQRSHSEVPPSQVNALNATVAAKALANYAANLFPAAASPTFERPSMERQGPPRASDDDEEVDEDEGEVTDEKGVKMDLKIRSDNIIPSLEGFKAHVQQLNPRLETFLVDRVSQEQIRRYKKLLENKIKHTHAVWNLKQCSSGKHCFELGGDATCLPPRPSTKDPEACSQFHVAGNAASGDESSSCEAAVTAALFPPGIPLPPVKKLPAEFECSLCFKVKRFQKPSDWTKHVHEDVAPFTCTFPNCTEPKSFKRKADWVRHENERHRHLEWWKCSIKECSHICYRKDNFVQHLVREHKKPEPKVKSRGSDSSKARTGNDPAAKWQAQAEEKQIEEVNRLMEECRSETSNKPKDEPCNFCGNVCSSWKKLNVHLAKHMEQIAMPVLELVRLREVSPDTIISPIESGSQKQSLLSTASPEMASDVDANGASPYDMSIAGPYPAASMGPSPSYSFYTPPMQDQPGFVNAPSAGYHGQMPLQAPSAADFAPVQGGPAGMSYGPYQEMCPPPSFPTMNSPVGGATTYPPPYKLVRRAPQLGIGLIPRSQPLHHVYGMTVATGKYEAEHGAVMVSSPTEHFAGQFEAGVNHGHGGAGRFGYNHGSMISPGARDNARYRSVYAMQGDGAGAQGYAYSQQ